MDEIVSRNYIPARFHLSKTCKSSLWKRGSLELSPERRQRTIVRTDGGGGRDADINWLLLGATSSWLGQELAALPVIG